MKNSVIYIIGATVLVGGGAYLFLKNKNKKDAVKLATLGGTTTGGTTLGGTTTGGATSSETSSSLSTTSDGVSPSDANINLANATILATEIKAIDKEFNTPFKGEKTVRGSTRMFDYTTEYKEYQTMQRTYKVRRDLKVVELAKLGYKVDAIGQLVKI